MRVTGRSWQEELYKIPDRVIAPAHIKGMHNYLTTWEKSVDVTDEFWGAQALERLSWFAPPKTVTRGGLAGGDEGEGETKAEEAERKTAELDEIRTQLSELQSQLAEMNKKG